MRARTVPALSALLAALAATGCQASPPGEENPDPGGAPKSGKPTASRSLELEQLSGKKLLIPETHGAVGADLPEFTPPHASYTVHFVCSGSGQVTLQANGKKWISYPCDGVENVAEQITDKTPQTVSLTLSGTARWKAAVADGSI